MMRSFQSSFLSICRVIITSFKSFEFQRVPNMVRETRTKRKLQYGRLRWDAPTHSESGWPRAVKSPS